MAIAIDGIKQEEEEEKHINFDIPQDGIPLTNNSELHLAGRDQDVWLVKVPRHLMERWSTIDEEDVQLGTIRVYQNVTSSSGHRAHPRSILFLSPCWSGRGSSSLSTHSSRAASTSSSNTSLDETDMDVCPDRYEFEMISETVDNEIVVGSRSHLGTSTSTEVKMSGCMRRQYHLRPLLTAAYRAQLRERGKRYNVPRRQIKLLGGMGQSMGQAEVNRLASGVHVDSSRTFSGFIKPGTKRTKKDRMVRLSRSELLDLLFGLFIERAEWTLKAMRERTQQPHVSLRSVLEEIAVSRRGMWVLADVFADGNRRSVRANLQAESGTTSVDERTSTCPSSDGPDEDSEEMETVA